MSAICWDNTPKLPILVSLMVKWVVVVQFRVQFHATLIPCVKVPTRSLRFGFSPIYTRTFAVQRRPQLNLLKAAVRYRSLWLQQSTTRGCGWLGPYMLSARLLNCSFLVGSRCDVARRHAAWAIWHKHAVCFGCWLNTLGVDTDKCRPGCEYKWQSVQLLKCIENSHVPILLCTPIDEHGPRNYDTETVILIRTERDCSTLFTVIRFYEQGW